MSPRTPFKADLDIQILPEGFAEQEALLAAMPEEMNKQLVSAVRKGNKILKDALVPRVKKFTGATSRSIGSRVKAFSPGSVTGVTGAGKRAYVFKFNQYGRAPGAKQPWWADLQEWVEAKWGTSGKESKKAAYGLARSIHKKGIKGEPVAGQVMQEKRRAVTDLLEKALEKIVKSLVVK